jgi:hypothetical protein
MLQGTIDAGTVPVSLATFLRASTMALSSAALAFDHPANGVLQALFLVVRLGQLLPSPRVSLGTVFGIIARHSNPGVPMAANDETAPAAAAKLFDEPVREVDDDRLDVYDRARDALNELRAALPSAAEDIERLLGRINAAYWEVCGVPANEVTPAPPGTEKPAP